MAGHSHATNVRLQKETSNLRIEKIKSVVARRLTYHATINSDPNTNTKLESEIRIAKALGVSKEQIERIIKNAATLKDVPVYQSIIVEAVWNNIALIIVVETNKMSRTLPELKSILTKLDGNIVSPQSISHHFKILGRVSVLQSCLNITYEELEELAQSDYDIAEYETQKDDEDETIFNVYYSPDNFRANKLLESLSRYAKSDKAGFISDYSLAYIPTDTRELSPDRLEMYNRLQTSLLMQEDVISVFDNVFFSFF